MKSIIGILLFCGTSVFGQPEFDRWFTGGTMRLDFILAGNNTGTMAYIYRISREKEWPGSRVNFSDPYLNGDYYFEIMDSASQNCVFSKSFNTLFGEWQTTAEAKKMEKAFQQTVFFPDPENTFLFRLFRRPSREQSEMVMEVVIDPQDYLIPEEEIIPEFREIKIHGQPANTVDITFIAEGYVKSEEEKFISDVKRFSAYLMSVPPFSEQKDKINIRAALSFSSESGTDNPGENDWKQTAAGTTFYTFGSERYLTTAEYWKLCDLIRNIPTDQIVVLVNSDKYGGGGIYNHFSVCTSDHPLSEIVFVHEFGHAFAGLGDEYYDSEVAYESFYPLDQEPLPPNLTTLVDFDLKWKDMLDKDTPLPTPTTQEFIKKTGVFEGGGYTAKGVYRPQMDCRMKSNQTPDFCKVCQRSIRLVIEHFSE